MNYGIIESKNSLPWVLRQSRDMQSWCKLFDLLLNNFKTNSDYWVSLIDYDQCPNHLLPLLASYVGYRYDYTESYYTNRLIIKNYMNMIRNRGSEIGMSLATALSVNALGEIDKVESLSMFHIDYVVKDGKIKIYIYFPANMSKVRDLIEVVRPAGVGLELIPAEIISTIDEIEIWTYVDPQKFSYDITRYTVRDEHLGDKLGDKGEDEMTPWQFSNEGVGFAEVENEQRLRKKSKYDFLED